ncbi:TIGR01777 family oxidoreductase [Cellulomonas sp. P24]|uniref:TIGR01777 family oxidoreductase n=1 Tax=Cellulomonas sp. P24 TaxID=2885206 RepID=UPI00216B1BFD|nr:TIGR01777 family oxidoreductase [Cellulomonas sp. P24]MCR6494185.1 TIGR01777 family oxidoreductase [Cellulomonas sp. P24]
MDVVVAGSHGLIGSAVVEHLSASGHQVLRLVRRPATHADEIEWDPAAGRLAANALSGADAVINLAGAGVGDHRLTPAYKRTVLLSRTSTTSLLARTMAGADTPPAVLLQGSAIGAYGDTGMHEVDETGGWGQTFLASVVREWEASTGAARDAGVRVAHLRSGIVLSPHGGALARMLPLLRAGLGGRLGSGRQYWSWITLEDEVRAIAHLLTSSVQGAVNLTAPHPVDNATVARALASALHRPAVVAVPAFALKIVLGEFSREVLGSIRAVPRALTDDGFTFRHPTIEDAADWLVRR